MKRDWHVYLVTGEEVFITQICRHCGRARPLSAFGLRRMADGKVRSIPWCRECRSKPENFRTHRATLASEPAG